MTIYTDGVHLCCFPYDKNELHHFASSMGLKRCWFQSGGNLRPHYDLTTPRKARLAVESGAIFVSIMDIGRMFRAYRINKKFKPVELDVQLIEHNHIRIMKIFGRK